MKSKIITVDEEVHKIVMMQKVYGNYESAGECIKNTFNSVAELKKYNRELNLKIKELKEELEKAKCDKYGNKQKA